jgi:prepilin-type N-terminal cleavage/methylation domain-containing protein
MKSLIKSKLPLRARPGFTLVETLISLTISSVMLALFFGTVGRVQRQSRVQYDMQSAEESLRASEMVLRTILQNAGADPYMTGMGRIRPDTLGTGAFNNLAIRSDFNPPNGNFNDMLEGVVIRVLADTLQVKWSASGAYQALAHPVHSVMFEFFDSAGTSLTTAAAVHSHAKSVRFTIRARQPGSTALRSRQTWVFLQNRR